MAPRQTSWMRRWTSLTRRCPCRGATPAVRVVALAPLAQRWRVSLREANPRLLREAAQQLRQAQQQLVHEAEQVLPLGVALLLSPRQV